LSLDMALCVDCTFTSLNFRIHKMFHNLFFFFFLFSLCWIIHSFSFNFILFNIQYLNNIIM
jgi:hypothetical protein